MTLSDVAKIRMLLKAYNKTRRRLIRKVTRLLRATEGAAGNSDRCSSLRVTAISSIIRHLSKKTKHQNP